MSIALGIRRLQSRPQQGKVFSPPGGGYKAPTHPLVGADTARIHTALVNSELGTMANLMDLFDDMRERDGRLDAVGRTRVLAVSGKRLLVKPPEDLKEDKEAQNIAKNVSTVLGEIEELPVAVGLLMDGVLRPYSVVENEWGTDKRGWQVPVALHWAHPNRFNYTRSMELVKYDQGVDPYPGTPLDSFGPDKFIVHRPHAGRAAYPTRRGVLRSTIYPTMTKRYGLQWWLIAAEQFGKPAPYITVPEGADDLYDDALEALRDLTADWQAVLTERMDIKTIPGSGAFSGTMHKDLVDTVNVENAITVLGQNLSTEVQGGSFAAAQAHEAVRADYLQADAAELASTLRQMLIEPIVRYNWPGAPVPVAEFVLVNEEAKSPEPWHYDRGIVDLNEVRESLGREARTDADAVEEVAVDPSAALNGAQIAALLEVVSKVASGQLPRAAGIAIMVGSFPIDTARAEEMMGEVGRTFFTEIDPLTGQAKSVQRAAHPAAPAPPAQPQPAATAPAPTAQPPEEPTLPPTGRTGYDRPFVTAERSSTLLTSPRSQLQIKRALSNTSGE